MDEMQCEGFKEDWFIFNREKPLSQSHLDRFKDRAIAEADQNIDPFVFFISDHSNCSPFLFERISWNA